jgi:lactate 2-monooxygenase
VDFTSFQNEIYLAGMGGQRPDLPISMAGLEARAQEVMAPEAYGYVAGAAGSEDTARENLAAFRRWRIVPRHLRDVSIRDLSRTILDTPLPAPVLLAPVGVLGMVHPDAELAVARAASSLEVPFVLSTLSSKTLEEVAEAAGDGPRWFQLYWPNEPELAASLLKRAEAAGYSAVVLTLDSFLLAWRPRDLEVGYLPFLKAQGIANYTSDPVFRAGLERPDDEDPFQAALRWVGVFPHPTASWEELRRLREQTTLPLLLKGILHPDDAQQAIDAGVDGLVVSNHGGRQVDGAVASLDALPEVVAAADGRVPVLFDSGIRTGADGVKALALGAAAVLLGRPYVWGLALAGEDGVRHVLRTYLADLELTMALAGLRSLEEIGPEILRPADQTGS